MFSQQQLLKKHLFRLSLALLVSVTAQSCTTTSFYTETIKNEYQQHDLEMLSPLDAETRAELVEAILAGDIAFAAKDYVSATSYYLYAAELSRAASLIQLALQAATLAEDPLGKEQAARLWMEIEPQSIDAQKNLVVALLQQQDLPTALQSAESLLRQVADNEKNYQLLSDIAAAAQNRSTLTFLQALSEESSQSSAATLAISKLISLWAAQSQNPQNALLQALAYADRALQNSPQFVSAIEQKAKLLFRLRRDEEAEALLREKFAADPDSKAIAALLGHLLYDLKKYHLAINHYRHWLKRHPEDLDARYYLAASYYAEGEFEKALNEFRPLLTQSFELETVAFYCGDSARRLKQWAQARACFARVDNGRFYYSAQMALAELDAQDKNWQQAIQRLQQAAQKAAADPEHSNTLIRLQLKEIDYLYQAYGKERALSRLDALRQEAPNTAAFLFKEIELRGWKNQPQQLVPLLTQGRELIKDESKRLTFKLAAAAFLFNNQHYSHAVSWLEQALQAFPDNPDLLYAKAIYLEPLNRVDEMIATFRRLLALSPDNISVLNALGYTLADHSLNLEEAEQLIEKALAAQPQNPAIIDSRGWLAYRQGDLQSALQYLRRAFQMQPQAEVGAHLGEVLWQLGEHEKAKLVWRKSLAMDADNRVLKATLSRFGVSRSELEN